MCPQKNRTWELRPLSHERLILQKTQTSSWPVNTHGESLPIPKPMNLLLGLWPDFSLHCPPHTQPAPTPSGLSRSLLHVFPELQFLCYPWINSISGHSCLPQFTISFGLTFPSRILLFSRLAPVHPHLSKMSLPPRGLPWPPQPPITVPLSVVYS